MIIIKMAIPAQIVFGTKIFSEARAGRGYPCHTIYGELWNEDRETLFPHVVGAMKCDTVNLASCELIHAKFDGNSLQPHRPTVVS